MRPTEGRVHSAQPPASERACSIESHREMEETLHSLRSLICDLLRENQELRTALLAERPETQAPPVTENH